MPTITHIDDGAVLELITARIEAAVGNGTPAIETLNFGEPLPAELEWVAAVAGLSIEPEARMAKGADADLSAGTLIIEVIGDPASVKENIYLLPSIAGKVARAFGGQTLRDPADGALGEGHEIVFGRARRTYMGAPPNEPRNLKICRIETPCRIKREAGDSITARE